ncbi:hypothetical protein KJ765_02535 [Candidatus Micrarchaeota archaeon]|nr:hypothetical protein [Candidatus Micrarchaeota archaeon]
MVFLVSIALSLSVSAGVAVLVKQDVDKATWQARPWMSPIITEEESKATRWIEENTLERDIFVTDIFGGEHIMGNTLREGTEGGDWAIVPGVVEKMGEINEFYSTKDADRAYVLATKHGAKYVLIPNRQIFAGFKWFYPEKGKMENAQYFKRVYSDNDFEIYQVIR